MTRKLFLLILLSSTSFAGARPSCELFQLTQWIVRVTHPRQVQYDIQTWVRSFPLAEQERMSRAMRGVLEDYAKRGKPVPPLGHAVAWGHNEQALPNGALAAVQNFQNETIERGNQWLKKMSRSSSLENHHGQSLVPTQLKPLSLDVYEFESEGKRWIFRPAKENDTYDARLTFSVSKLNKMMNLDTVPRTHFGRLKHAITDRNNPPANLYGTFTEHVEGTPPAFKYIQTINSQADPRSLRDTEGFEFLIGNSDVHSKNFVVDSLKKIKVFDHNHALPPYPYEYNSTAYIGRIIPKSYNSHFVEELKNLTPERLRNEMGEHLEEFEIEAILFRRDLMLKDIELRGQSAIVP